MAEQLARLEKKGIPGRDVFGSPAIPLGKGKTEVGKAKSSHGGTLLLTSKEMGCVTLANVKRSNGIDDNLGDW